MALYKDIIETVRMIDKENLDIRTTTMGISLLDCIDSDQHKCQTKIYDKIARSAEHLVEEADKMAAETGVPIVNKRISVTPIALIAGATDALDYAPFAKTLDQAAKAVGVNYIGGFSALVPKGETPGDHILIQSIPEALTTTEHVCASVNLGSTKSGINMDCVKQMGHIVKKCAELTKDNDSIGASKLVVFCNAVEDNPFMAGAFHGVGQPDKVLHVGVSGPGVVKVALEKNQDATMDELAEIIKKTAFKITRAGQLVGTTVADRLGIPFGILDLSLAPTPAIGDSVARIIEEMGIEHCGGPGTTAALAMLNDAVKKGGIMASTSVGGLSGAFIPVSEDEGMIDAARNGHITIEKLEAMTCVCSVGLDMIAIPGDTPDDTISAIIADEAAIGMVNNKTTACRLIPAIGKTVGDEVTYGGLFGSAPIMPVNLSDASVFVNRGGKIPAPIHSFKN
ncbi:PFL family protein [Pseudoramibacter porci]|uniref:UPF0210 protein FYJ52_09645 n=1 Tax=Pseudoramibacter porci TaxID=2606631 RepID=A0A7X2NHD3_9FIRM|nr:PFL family protein [Pseudoramibacter porci]MSS20656.1 PFL family protein [Pseudoramibacter porci]